MVADELARPMAILCRGPFVLQEVCLRTAEYVGGVGYNDDLEIPAGLVRTTVNRTRVGFNNLFTGCVFQA